MDLKVKKYIFLVISLMLIGLVVLLAGRYYLVNHAKKIATDILLNAEVAKVEKVTFVTKHVHELFHSNKNDKNFPLLLRLRPYLTNEKLPKFISLPEGMIETISPYGWCDNAARMTKFVLAQDGIKSRQWNMVTPTAAHAALQIRYNEKEVLIDPFYGVIPEGVDGNSLSAEAAKNEKQKGRNPFVLIASTSNIEFYESFENVMMAAQGDPLELLSNISLDKGELKIGKIDGSSYDVYKEGVKNKISPHWTYIGHRYDRSWTRKLSVDEPAKVTFVLTKEPLKKVITSNEEPIISGNKLTWVLDEGEQLIFNDGEAGFLWSDLKSYIEVDQIIITPLGSAS